MTLVNSSNKIINLGTDPILPGETRPVNKATAELPSIKALVEHNLVQIIADAKTSLDGKEVDTSAETRTSAKPFDDEKPATPAESKTTGDDAISDPSLTDKKAPQNKKK